MNGTHDGPQGGLAARREAHGRLAVLDNDLRLLHATLALVADLPLAARALRLESRELARRYQEVAAACGCAACGAPAQVRVPVALAEGLVVTVTDSWPEGGPPGTGPPGGGPPGGAAAGPGM